MNVNIVTAPEHRYFPLNSMKVFLAGGICKCVEWQKKIIEKFLNDDEPVKLTSDYNDLYILNPRRTDWLEREGEAIRQIEWEFDMIERCDMFTMYFAGGESDQPICMYELGRNLLRMQYEYPSTWQYRIVITCDSSYKRLQDVLVQTRLATNGLLEVNVVDGAEESINKHYSEIKDKLHYIYAH